MSFDLTLGFRKKPTDLRSVLERRGFTLDRVLGPDNEFPVKMGYYKFFNERRSNRGVWLVYHDGIYADHGEGWKSIVDDPGAIVATASLSINMGWNTFDEQTQQETARLARDHYRAILYDPQSGKLVTD